MAISPPADRDERNQFYRDRYLSGTPFTEEMLAEEAEIAAECLAARDFARGFHAIGIAVGLRPFNAEWNATLAALFDAADIGAEKFTHARMTPGQAEDVGRIYTAYRRHEFIKVYDDLTTLCTDVPHSQLPEAWGITWLTEDMARAVGREKCVEFLVKFVQNRYPEPADATEYACGQLSRAVETVEMIERLFGSDPRIVLFKCQMLGKARRFDDAKRVSITAFEGNPTFNTATAVAMAHKRAGDRDGAVTWFRKAAEIDPTCEWTLLDIGDMMVDDGKYEVALSAYEEALKRVPNHDWAVPSAVFCRYKMTGEKALYDDLRGMALAMPCKCGLADQMKEMRGGYNYEDCRVRATTLMKELEPDFDAEALRGPFTGCPHPPPEKKPKPKHGDPKTKGWKK